MVLNFALLRFINRDLEGALALGQRHREELALLAADEQAVDAELAGPVPDIAAEAGLVDRKIGRERGQRRGPDALHMLARIGLCVFPIVFHGSVAFDVRSYS